MTAKTIVAGSRRFDTIREFWTGFSEPSRLGLLAIVVGFLAMTMIAAWFFSERTLTGPMGKYLARSQLDAEAFATHRALQIRAAPALHPRLIVLGTSATANAIAEELPLADELRAATGMEWDVHLLTTPLQSALDQMTLIEAALGPSPERDQPVVIAVGVSMLRQSWTTADLLKYEYEGRLGLRSSWADEEVAAIGGTPRPRIGFYPFDNYHFVAANGCEALLRLILHMPARRKLDTFAPEVSIPPAKRSRTTVAAKIRKGLQDNSAYLHEMTALLRHLSEQKRVRIVQIEEPVSPGFLQTTGLTEVKDQVARQFEEFGAKTGMIYLPIITDAQIPDEAYHDDLHIYGKTYQAKVRKAFANRLAQLVSGGWLR